MPGARIPILEIGGTHVTAAWVSAMDWQVSDLHRIDLNTTGTADELIGSFARAADGLRAPAGADWGIAMPGPFDFAGGIAHYSGVGKFDNLNGIDVRSALLSAIERQPASISFINDASAFLVGEWLAGSARGAETCAGLTLGTGVGSAFLDNGKVIDTGQDVPPDGEVHLINYHGRPLEDWVSRRAIIRSFAAAREDKQDLDVRDIIDLARSGDPVASKVVDDAFVLLGEIVGPWLNRFGAEVLVIGGSISKSWDLIESPLNKGLSGSVPAVRVAADLENAPLVGAAYPAVIRGRSTLVD